jgi:hypothetical protein
MPQNKEGTMDGLLITHEGKRYFVRPEVLQLCLVSDADWQEVQKNRKIPEGPVVALQPHKAELSLEELSKAVGGSKTTGNETVMCPW